MKTSANVIPDQIDNIAGSEAEVVGEFVHLGLLMRTDGNSTSEIKRTIMTAIRCCYGLLRHLRSKLFKKKRTLKSTERSSRQSWIKKKYGVNLISIFGRKVLHTMFGAVREGDRWRPKYNFELQQDSRKFTIVPVAKVPRLRWVRHLERNRVHESYSGTAQVGSEASAADECAGMMEQKQTLLR